MKIRPMRAELFHADGRTDRHTTKLIVAFRNFANVYKMGHSGGMACLDSYGRK
jgi:hypothetical protein